METDIKNLSRALKLSHVPRWGIIDTLKQQTVADHCYRTTILADFISCFLIQMGVEVDRFMVMAKSLIHDLDEAETGDIPSTFKDKVGMPSQNSQLSTIEDTIIATADVMEALIFTKRYILRPQRVNDYLDRKMEVCIERLSGLACMDSVILQRRLGELFSEGFYYD